MCLSHSRTDDFKTSGLAGRRLVGFYAIRLPDNHQLSIGVYHTDLGAQEEPVLQALDIHSGWKPFVPSLIDRLNAWARLPNSAQTRAQADAEAQGLAPPQSQDCNPPEAQNGVLADVVVIHPSTKHWRNVGPHWRPGDGATTMSY